MVYVLRHLPTGYPRTLRCNDGALSHLAYRCLPPLLSGDLDPTARAVAERFECNKDTAAKALRSLEVCGYLRRWRTSIGRNAWLHYAIVTDEPYAWEVDPAFAAQVVHWQDQKTAAFRDRHGYALDADPVGPPPPVPQPRPVADDPPPETTSDSVASPQVNSCPTSSDPKDSDIPIKDSLQESPPPSPPSRGQVIHSPRRQRDPVLRSIRRSLTEHPELEPHLPAALAVLEGLRFSPPDRARGARVLATALRQGYTMSSVITWLTSHLGTARNREIVQKWRINQLAGVVGVAPAFFRGRSRSVPVGKSVSLGVT